MGREKFDMFIHAVVENKNTADKLLRDESDLINTKNGIGETVFHYLVVENKLEDTKWLLDKGAEINTTNEFGNTPLAEAASLGLVEMCQFLLANGADHRITAEDGSTALSQAATSEKIEVLHILLDLVQSNEKLDDYFDFIDYDVLLDKEGGCARAIADKGLKWLNEEQST